MHAALLLLLGLTPHHWASAQQPGKPLTADSSTLTSISAVSQALSSERLVPESQQLSTPPTTQTPAELNAEISTASPQLAATAAAIDDSFVETAFDLFVGGNYYGFVSTKYNDNWIELSDPQEAIYLLPLIRNRQEMLPLFQGRITGAREISQLGSLTVDHNNFAIKVNIAPQQAIQTAVDPAKINAYEGSPTFLTRLSARGNRPFKAEDDTTRVTLDNHTRLAYNQHRLLTFGSYNDVEANYDLRNLQGETDFQLLETPLTLSAGLLDIPGQEFASSLDIAGISITSNHRLYADDPLYNSNQLSVFIPSRSLVEVFKDSAESGDVLFSRMLDFGHAEIDTRGFPRGSYPVVIVVSTDGIEQSRHNEQFYKYEDILPREQVDLNFTVGNYRQDLEFYDTPVAYGSLRLRMTDYLEADTSLYMVDDRLIFSQGIKGIYTTQQLGEFRYEFSLAESNTGTLLGYSSNLSWSKSAIAASITYSKAFEDDSVVSDGLQILDFNNRESIDFNLSRNFNLNKRSLNIALKGRYRDSELNQGDYRYGPTVRFTPYRDRNTSFMLTAQHDWTESGKELRLSLNFNYRFGTVTASSFLNSARQPEQTRADWQNSVRYQGNEKSPGLLRKVTAKALHSLTHTDSDNSGKRKTNASNVDVEYKGEMLESRVYVNHSSSSNSGTYGGELVSTFVAGGNNLLHMSGAVPLASAIVAVTLNGQPDKKNLISILVNGSQRAYMHIGETALISVPVYKTSKIEVRDADPQTGELIKIINPRSTVTPYPGNVIKREIDIARIALVSGTLLDGNNNPFANLFFETGAEPAYTDDRGDFVVEMPIRPNDKNFDFIVRQQLCSFSVEEIDTYMLVEAGQVQCLPASAEQLQEIRARHDRQRVF